MPSLVASVMIVGSGCVSIPNGLCSTDGAEWSTFDPKLIGSWEPVVTPPDTPSDAIARFHRLDPARNTYAILTNDKLHVLTMFNLVTIDGSVYMDSFLTENPKELFSDHYFSRIEVKEDTLTIQSMAKN